MNPGEGSFEIVAKSKMRLPQGFAPTDDYDRLESKSILYYLKGGLTVGICKSTTILIFFPASKNV